MKTARRVFMEKIASKKLSLTKMKKKPINISGFFKEIRIIIDPILSYLTTEKKF